MKKLLILSGIAMFCLLGQTNAAVPAATKKAPVTHFASKKARTILDVSNGSYFNSNAFAITLEFWQFGHPSTVINIPPGYSWGNYSVPYGTYDVVMRGSGPALYLVSGRPNQQGTVVTFASMTFNSSSSVTFTCDLPE